MKTARWVPASQEHFRDESLEVKEPDAHTEFEIQAMVWWKLREMGVNARGEVKTSYSGRAQVRFDIAVFEAGRLAGVIEVKANEKKNVEAWEKTRQGFRYAQFGVPVRPCCGMVEAMTLIDDARNGRLWQRHGPPVP